uniref:SH3 domain-containing protein Dlish-like n=1 Tax=Diabrotica virgifera virgifera TaxID=50390 RepID=A0A6P7H208_DIAVI
MAFLCPVRIRRGKKKKASNIDLEKELTRSNNGATPGMGRITGSASIETLVRVGIEKEHGLSPDSKMVVLHDFTPCVDDELEVKRGQCKVMTYIMVTTVTVVVICNRCRNLHCFVVVLNREDPDWYWIVRSDGQEGFIPSGFVYPADNVIQGHLSSTTQPGTGAFPNQNNNHSVTTSTADDLRYHGTELVMLYDYKAQAPDDLTVRRGDWIYADLNNQTVDGWLWAYAPKTRKYGFIPKAYARPPAMTSL